MLSQLQSSSQFSASYSPLPKGLTLTVDSWHLRPWPTCHKLTANLDVGKAGLQEPIPKQPLLRQGPNVHCSLSQSLCRAKVRERTGSLCLPTVSHPMSNRSCLHSPHPAKLAVGNKKIHAKGPPPTANDSNWAPFTVSDHTTGPALHTAREVLLFTRH